MTTEPPFTIFDQNGKTCIPASINCGTGQTSQVDVSEINVNFEQENDGETVTVSECMQNPSHCANLETCESDENCFQTGGNKMVCGSIKANITQ